MLPEPLVHGVLELEGEELRVVDLGHTDTDDTTALHVPSTGLLVAGDAVYNDVHLYMAESPAAERRAWLAALDTLEALDATTVVAGHKRPERADSPTDIAATRQYLHDFDELATSASDTSELYRGLLSRHPHRVNAGAAWGWPAPPPAGPEPSRRSPASAHPVPRDRSSRSPPWTSTPEISTRHRPTNLLIGSIIPRPIAWVSTLSTEGVPNIAPISFFTCVGRKPPRSRCPSSPAPTRRR